MPLRAALQAAAECGSTGVQFDLRDELPPTALTESGRRDLRHLLDELGLQVAGATFPLRRSLTDEYELDRRIAALKQAMSWAFNLSARVLTFRIGHLPIDQNDPQTVVLREILDDLARHANHVGVTLAISPGRESAAELNQTLSAVQSGPLGVDFDPAQFAMAGHDPVAALRTLHALTYHVQLRDGFAELDGGGAETAVGQGSVPWIEMLATLGEIEYSGWLTAIRTQGADKASDLRNAIASIQRLLLGG